MQPPADESAFSSVEVAARASDTFMTPRSGTPLPSGDVAFVAMQPATDEQPARPGLFRASLGEPPTLLYSGDRLQNPLDLDISANGASLFVADSVYLDDNGENAGGAVLVFPVEGGEPAAKAIGYVPRAVTVAEAGDVYFSGADPESGEAGVFELSDDTAEKVFVGSQLVEPSGVAVFDDGRVLVADTRHADSDPTMPSRAAVLLIDGGEASVFASGFELGYPAGLALTKDESVLIVSGQGADSSNLVFLIDTARPDAAPGVETAFAEQQWSSGGLHRQHGTNRFAWCDTAAEGGTIYSIEGR